MHKKTAKPRNLQLKLRRVMMRDFAAGRQKAGRTVVGQVDNVGKRKASSDNSVRNEKSLQNRAR